MEKDFKKKIIKALLLLAYVIVACIFVIIVQPVYLLSILIVLLPPSIMNFIWLKKSKGKVLLFSILTTLLFAPPVELIARLADVWDVQSILPRIFGIAPIENLLFAFFNFFWVLSFYEYFIDRDTATKTNKRFKYLLILYAVLLVVVLIGFFINPNLIALNYHVLAAIILLIPGLILFIHKPKLLKKALIPTIFFAVVFFVYEVVSLAIGSWWWPGQYLLSVTLVGTIFPLDDVIIWYFLSTPILIMGYEFFADDDQ